MTIEGLVIVGGLVAVIYGFFRWLGNTRQLPPEPWGAEIEHLVQDPETPALCHHCLTPHAHDARFCPECGAAVGLYNNYLPFVNVFSEGEVLRAGVTNRMKPSLLIILGYLCYSSIRYLIFAPIYWYFFFGNLRRHQAETGPET
jgi:hypothetical protein